LSLPKDEEEYPCFIVNDLSKDGRFASLPVVDGRLSSYRFYAGAPISTSHGVNIGSIFMFDDVVREGLSLPHRKCMFSKSCMIFSVL
jgi:GAF domain-containing protein